MKINARRHRLAACLAIALVAATATAATATAATATAATSTAAASAGFITRPLDLGAGSYRMYDLGVTDYNRDGDLDVFSTNHTTRMSLRTGDGTLNYPTDAVTSAGLDSDPALPGIEAVGAPADQSAPGLYIYRATPGVLVVSAVTGPGLAHVQASLTFFGNVNIHKSAGVTTTVTPGTDSLGRPTNTVAFTAAATGSANLTLELDAVTLQASVSSPADPDEIHLGSGALAPPSTDFSWFFHDRHGVSWSDVNGDGQLDMTIANGGLKDQISTYPGLTADEVLIAGASTFTNETPDDLIEGHCRSRAVHWVDVNDDGLLDLFITCEDEPARLLIRTGLDTFTDASAELPTIPGAVPFLWIDLDGDHIPELIVPTSAGIGVYTRSSSGAYLRTQRIAPAATYTDLALADINHDGLPDIYAASPTASQLLIDKPGGFSRVLPSHYGLPNTAQRASWVDVDNDGRTDLFTVPGGLYLQRKTGHFAASGQLDDLFPASATNQLFEWFDGDNDGDRDLVSEYQLPGSYVGTVSMTENQDAKGHWLELDLVGPPEDLTAVGASVAITVGGVTTTHWVGESDSATSSQGHYRIYAGLGAAKSTQSIVVTWPDGATQTVPNAGNKRLVVTHP